MKERAACIYRIVSIDNGAAPKPLPINLVIEISLLYIHSENHHHAKKYKQSTFPFISCISCISPQ